jgi:predicted nucleic acid-binding protein
MVYLENSALIDLADPTEQRHADAMQLLALFQRYQNSELLWLTTSLWAITECHSVLYRKALEQLGIARPMRGGRRRDLRNLLPPNQAALITATQQKETLLQTLSTTTDFRILPAASSDSSRLLQLTMRLAEEAAIWAPDSIHVAIALESGDCQIIVTDDGDLLDKIDDCQAHLIQPYRQQQFSMLPTPPSFNAYGVARTTSELPSQRGLTRLSALQALNALGFR